MYIHIDMTTFNILMPYLGSECCCQCLLLRIMAGEGRRGTCDVVFWNRFWFHVWNIYWILWEPKTFIFRGYNPYIVGLKPSFFMVLGSKRRMYLYARSEVVLKSICCIFIINKNFLYLQNLHKEMIQQVYIYVYLSIYIYHVYIYIHTRDMIRHLF